MGSLLDELIETHGGLARWEALDSLHAHLRQGGVFWGVASHAGELDDVFVTAKLHEQFVRHEPFREAGLHSTYTPERTSVERADGRVVAALDALRDSFSH